MAACLPRGGNVLRSLGWYRDLSKSKGRREQGFFLVEGMRATLQVMSQHPEAIEEVLIDDNIVETARFGGGKLRRLTSAQLKSISSSAAPSGIIALVRIPDDVYVSSLPANAGKRVIVLEDVQDPGNIGTLIRSAAAFDCDGVLMSRQCADPFSPKAVQASAGAVMVPWIRRCNSFIEAIDELKRTGFSLYCADVRGEPFMDFGSADRAAFVFGNEGAGVSSQVAAMADRTFSVPMNSGAIESLNVAICGAITMFFAYTRCNPNHDSV